MSAIKFSKQYIKPNPNEIDYWVDLSSNPYGGKWKYYNGADWVDLINVDGIDIDFNDYYNKLLINQMLSEKASASSVESKVDDEEVADVVKNIEFKDRGDGGIEMVMLKYDDTTVGITLPIASNTTSGIITKETFKDFVKQNQLQQLYTTMYDTVADIRQKYQPRLSAGKNIVIDRVTNTIHATGKISTEWDDLINVPDLALQPDLEKEIERATNAENVLDNKITSHVTTVETSLDLKADKSDTYTKSQIDSKLSGVYRIKGSCLFEELPTNPIVGDTWNIINDFTLNGEEHPFGTNVVYTDNGWDALAGIFDSSELEGDISGVSEALSQETIRAVKAEQANADNINDVRATYLPLSGGTMTHSIKFNGPQRLTLLSAKYDETNYTNVIYTKYGTSDDPGSVAIFGSPYLDTVILETSLPQVYRQTSGIKYNIWDSGNLTKLSQLTDDVVSGKYLPLTGGTLAIDSIDSLEIKTNTGYYASAIKYKNDGDGVLGYLGIGGSLSQSGISPVFMTKDLALVYKIWHEGNDGDGSGLDADMLDGYHSTFFCYVINQSNIDCNSPTYGSHAAIYRFDNSPINAFPNAAYGNVLVVGASRDTMFQLGAPCNSNNLYFRTGTYRVSGGGVPIEDTPWKQVAFTDSNITGNAATADKLKLNELEENTDLNNLTKEGIYTTNRTSVATSLLNKPVNTPTGELRIEVSFYSNYQHVLLKLFAKDAARSRIYYRNKYADTWSDWKQIATTDSTVDNTTKLNNKPASDFYDLKGGTVIPEGADLNEYKTPGTFYCAYDATAATLLNWPHSKAGTLVVIYPNGNVNYSRQYAMDFSTSKIYTRLLWYSTNSWGDWVCVLDNLNTYNAPTATKLATPVKLWGNEFDGSKSVHGDLYMVRATNTAGDTNTDSAVLRFNGAFKNDSDDNLNIIGPSIRSISSGHYGRHRLSIFQHDADDYTTENEVLTISPNGNVGIGTDNPVYKLDVKGTTKLRSDLYCNNGFAILTLIGDDTRSVVNVASNGMIIGYGYSQNQLPVKIVGGTVNLLYGPSNTNGLILNSSGNVTIGSTDLAGTNYKFCVDGASSFSFITIENNTPLSTKDVNGYSISSLHRSPSGDLVIGYGNADYSYRTLIEGDSILFLYGLRTTGMILNSSGNVGIGTLSPNKKLHVSGAAQIDDTLTTANASITYNITSGDLVDWYGVSWSEDSSDPTCTRIGNMALHRSLPILNAMKRYAIQQETGSEHDGFIREVIGSRNTITGVVDNSSRYTIVTSDPLNVMVKIPEFWYVDDYEPSTKTHNLKISQTAKAGWIHHKESYVGAYEGYSDGTYYKSSPDVIPTVSVSRSTLRPLARANGYEDEYKWNIYTYEEHRAICHLFLVEYATRNSQLAVNTELTADGFKQGGLGSGCTTGTVTINGVTTYSFIPTGTTDSLGNGSGQVAYTIMLTDADGNETTAVTRYANRYRGIENPFGHIWKHVDDIVNVYTTYKTVYKCDKPEYFATNKNAKYKPLCSFPGGSKMQGWPKEIKATRNCDFFKYSVGGSESTYWCDYNYDNDDTSEHCLLIGGRSGYGGGAGLFAFALSNGVGYSTVYVGSRLTYLPWAE